MGNKCDCVGEKTEASQFTIDKIKNNFYRGLQHQKININSEEETRLNNFIDDSTQYSVKDSETLTLKDQQ